MSILHFGPRLCPYKTLYLAVSCCPPTQHSLLSPQLSPQLHSTINELPSTLYCTTQLLHTHVSFFGAGAGLYPLPQKIYSLPLMFFFWPALKRLLDHVSCSTHQKHFQRPGMSGSFCSARTPLNFNMIACYIFSGLDSKLLWVNHLFFSNHVHGRGMFGSSARLSNSIITLSFSSVAWTQRSGGSTTSSTQNPSGADACSVSLPCSQPQYNRHERHEKRLNISTLILKTLSAIRHVWSFCSARVHQNIHSSSTCSERESSIKYTTINV